MKQSAFKYAIGSKDDGSIVMGSPCGKLRSSFPWAWVGTLRTAILLPGRHRRYA